VLLASFTVAYVPGAIVERRSSIGLQGTFHEGVLGGWTDGVHDPAAGSVGQPQDRLYGAAAWELLRRWRWVDLPRLVLEDAAHRYGYRLGRRLHRLPLALRHRFIPELQEAERPPWTESERAA
jgi:hypothetical protein